MSHDVSVHLHSLEVESYYEPREFPLPDSSRSIFIPNFRSLVALQEFLSQFPSATDLLCDLENHLQHILLSCIHMGAGNIPPEASLPSLAVYFPKLNHDLTPPHLRLDPLYTPVEVNFFGRFHASITSLETLSALRQIARSSPRPDHSTIKAVSIGLAANRRHRLKLQPSSHGPNES